MRPGLLRLSGLGAFALASASTAIATESAAPPAQSAPPAKIFGYFDAKTHVFTPASEPQPVSEAAFAASVVVAGQMTIKGTIAIDPTIPADQTIDASVTFAVTDAIYNNSVAGVVPVKRSGHTGTFTLSFAYRMAVAKASEPAMVYVITSASSPTNPFAYLSKTIPLPANGANTVVDFPASL